MINLRKHTPRWVVVFLDLLLNLSALAFAYLIRFDLKADYSIIQEEWNVLSKSIFFYIFIGWFSASTSDDKPSFEEVK